MPAPTNADSDSGVSRMRASPNSSSSPLVTALGNLPAAAALDPGGTLTYTRRLYVGNRNDVASSASPIITELGIRRGFGTGTISGDVDASDTPNVAASVVATRTGGTATPGFATGAPTTHFRTDASGTFSGVVLPAGTYDLEVRAVERDTVTVTGVTVTASADTPVSVPQMTGLGTVDLSVVESVVGSDPAIPAKVTFKGISPTPDPVFKKDFEALALVLPSGPHTDLMPETFAGGPAHRNALYLADGTESLAVHPRGLLRRRRRRAPSARCARRDHTRDGASSMEGFSVYR